MHQSEKVGTVFPLSYTGTTHVTVVAVPCCQLSLYTLCFQTLWSSGSENYNIVRSRVHYILQSKYSQNPNTTFKIRLWVFPHGLWRASSSKHREIPSKLMKREWKYPLKHQAGGEGTPLERQQIGSPDNQPVDYGQSLEEDWLARCAWASSYHGFLAWSSLGEEPFFRSSSKVPVSQVVAHVKFPMSTFR